MTADSFRFLGLAFASADLLFEIDDGGKVAFCAGAGGRLAGQTEIELMGRSWLELFAPQDHAMAEALIAGLVNGERRGPVDLQLAKPVDGQMRLAGLSAFRLPQVAPKISCALSLGARLAPSHRSSSGALMSRRDFEGMAGALIEAARVDGVQLELSLVELNGLERSRAGLSSSEAEGLDRRVTGALRAESYADAAADLGEQRFAVLRKPDGEADGMARRLTRVLGAAVQPVAHAIPVDEIAAPSRAMRALRFSLDTFLTEGPDRLAGSLSDMVGQSVERTVAQAGAFGALVRDRRFKLVFQPVISLADRSVHHHEVLVRFDGDRSPFAMIRMAEELDIIEHLDLAVAQTAIARLRADRSLTLAVNVSGRTIVSQPFLKALHSELKDPAIGQRLMVEITESSAIDDLATAQRHVESLQALGAKVCLDDFGSGAASFAYLQQLPIDVVKIDGSYVRELASSGRDGAMIRHLVGLCHELGVEVVAEMVEAQPIEDVLRRAGVDYAQGWLYGQPTPEPAWPNLRADPPPVRRQGVTESWGVSAKG